MGDPVLGHRDAASLPGRPIRQGLTRKQQVIAYDVDREVIPQVAERPGRVVDGVDVRRKARLCKPQRAGFVNAPRPPGIVRIGQADVAALVVREVQVVAAERILDSVGHANQRWMRDADVAMFSHV